jgi:hypothetical protein
VGGWNRTVVFYPFPEKSVDKKHNGRDVPTLFTALSPLASVPRVDTMQSILERLGECKTQLVLNVLKIVAEYAAESSHALDDQVDIALPGILFEANRIDNIKVSFATRTACCCELTGVCASCAQTRWMCGKIAEIRGEWLAVHRTYDGACLLSTAASSVDRGWCVL